MHKFFFFFFLEAMCVYIAISLICMQSHYDFGHNIAGKIPNLGKKKLVIAHLWISSNWGTSNRYIFHLIK